MKAAFYANLLQIYSLFISVIIAIGAQSLTRLHAVFALLAVVSPLTMYLVVHAVFSGKVLGDSRLISIFGFDTSELSENVDEARSRRVWAAINRLSVLAIVPTWVTLLVLVLVKPAWFQQTSCDSGTGSLIAVFLGDPLSLLHASDPQVLAVGVFLVPSWVAAICFARAAYFRNLHSPQELPSRDFNSFNYKPGSKKPTLATWTQIWRMAIERYPFLKFCTIIVFPFTLWITVLEDGAYYANERLEPTFGQVGDFFIHWTV